MRVITERCRAEVGARRCVCGVERDAVRSTVSSSSDDPFFGYWVLSRTQRLWLRGGQGLGARYACILRASTRALADVSHSKETDPALGTASHAAACGHIARDGGIARNSSHRLRSSGLALREPARLFEKDGWRASEDAFAQQRTDVVKHRSARVSPGFKDRSQKQLFVQNLPTPSVISYQSQSPSMVFAQSQILALLK